MATVSVLILCNTIGEFRWAIGYYEAKCPKETSYCFIRITYDTIYLRAIDAGILAVVNQVAGDEFLKTAASRNLKVEHLVF